MRRRPEPGLSLPEAGEEGAERGARVRPGRELAGRCARRSPAPLSSPGPQPRLFLLRSPAAAGGEQARRAPEMPAAGAAGRAAPAAARALAAGECPSHLRRNPDRRGAPEPRKASRPARTASAWRSGSPGPRLVFNRVNGRRPLATPPSLEVPQETYTLAHEENVRFVSEAWQQVEQQLDGGLAGESGPRPVQYVERTPDPRLQNFVPLDLDEWWAQQFLARITNCS
ncbi:MAPK regulated corepressor interacting protein 2-like isoform X3 [Dipodomys merriami]|uniref:MAPK regulated corepressor interacting protein 2-like isoform X3 n=1 Tax=Dipodomys merriami TaxID=94247 RepID=UPI003855C94B